ncbi:hypothetical protein RhiirC2_785138 [Rhizophagus irregularis]|uniref:Uncharacterized protein n=1 Tax=Rhizophagus irregularis TaxID=588596 RepID=A0A2N1MWY4_9GLOM|nr:hypothetical protein RhiirC2_785138 [Rhizophagus irregularis]
MKGNAIETDITTLNSAEIQKSVGNEIDEKNWDRLFSKRKSGRMEGLDVDFWFLDTWELGGKEFVM